MDDIVFSPSTLTITITIYSLIITTIALDGFNRLFDPLHQGMNATDSILHHSIHFSGACTRTSLIISLLSQGEHLLHGIEAGGAHGSQCPDAHGLECIAATIRCARGDAVSCISDIVISMSVNSKGTIIKRIMTS
jgi:hypothetical protein